MSSYASNQFFGFGQNYESNKSLKRQPDDNPNFLWPRPNKPDVYNPLLGPQVVDTRLQRGFIRGIYPTVLGGTSNPSASGVRQRRLFFQFNPPTLQRSVSMNSMVANPLLQDPSQIYQPVAGTAAFSFDLLFNREAEVVSAMYAREQVQNGGYVTNTATPITRKLDDYGGNNTNWGDVATLGVLADLYILDSIIGQSITPDMVEFLKKYWQNASDITKQYAATGAGASVGFDATGFETNIKNNYGNSSFLSPLPVRIVFSSLFMVEGFVESTSVEFVKFSQDYVPTICKVNLNVRALYIGFAREEAYLTTSIKAAAADMQLQQKADAGLLETAKNISAYDIHFQYGSPQLKKFISGVGEKSITNYSTFGEFYNDGTTIEVADWANLRFLGTIKSWVSPTVSAKVKNGEITWDFTSEFVMEEVLTGGGTKILAQGKLAYLNDSIKDYRTSTEVATETNKANSLKEARKHKYYAVPYDIDQESFSKTMTNATNPVKVTFTHAVTVTCNTSTGPQTVTTTETQSFNISAFQQWLIFNGNNIKYNFPQKGRPGDRQRVGGL